MNTLPSIRVGDINCPIVYSEFPRLCGGGATNHENMALHFSGFGDARCPISMPPRAESKQSTSKEKNRPMPRQSSLESLDDNEWRYDMDSMHDWTQTHGLSRMNFDVISH
ncbi:hypothetical protein LEN26_013426 [Aphanomyces euteiches]|nr:hypothetical protein LEN26_013426 [Aphanomyces euteiches]KAH9116957.1 hypothetical protein AeMF1_009164 [Aphanomyces euteiches]KAH9195840.1 hypothetical protein AeNC1_002188 [Aphanomyces euteiches]